MTPAFLMSLPPPTPPSNQTAPPKRARPSTLARKYRPTSSSEGHQLVGNSTSPKFPLSPIRFSRFPTTWSEAVDQVVSSVITAVGQGHDRIRLDLRHPEVIPASPFPSTLSIYQHRISLFADAAVKAITALFRMDPRDPRNFGMTFRPRRAVIFFDSATDAELGHKCVPEELRCRVHCDVLGTTRQVGKNDLLVVVAPRNRQGDPAHLEKVEAVHYANWVHDKIVLIINPQLMAMTSFAGLGGERREPCFLSDYIDCFYMDPVVCVSDQGRGAILKCFPRKWEMYWLRVRGEGFRLVAEQQDRFSGERIRCQFGWRVDPDVENAVVL